MEIERAGLCWKSLAVILLKNKCVCVCVCVNDSSNSGSYEVFTSSNEVWFLPDTSCHNTWTHQWNPYLVDFQFALHLLVRDLALNSLSHTADTQTHTVLHFLCRLSAAYGHSAWFLSAWSPARMSDTPALTVETSSISTNGCKTFHLENIINTNEGCKRINNLAFSWIHCVIKNM